MKPLLTDRISLPDGPVADVPLLEKAIATVKRGAMRTGEVVDIRVRGAIDLHAGPEGIKGGAKVATEGHFSWKWAARIFSVVPEMWEHIRHLGHRD